MAWVTSLGTGEIPEAFILDSANQRSQDHVSEVYLEYNEVYILVKISLYFKSNE